MDLRDPFEVAVGKNRSYRCSDSLASGSVKYRLLKPRGRVTPLLGWHVHLLPLFWAGTCPYTDVADRWYLPDDGCTSTPAWIVRVTASLSI
jgi:hypothetical protein